MRLPAKSQPVQTSHPKYRSGGRPLRWGPEPPDILKAYFAGLFDGEGSVTSTMLSSRSAAGPVSRLALAAHIANTDIRPLELVRSHYGGSIHARRGVSRIVYGWKSGSLMQAAYFWADIYPYTIIKRERINAALMYADTLLWPRIGQNRLTPDGERLKLLAWTFIRRQNAASKTCPRGTEAPALSQPA